MPRHGEACGSRNDGPGSLALRVLLAGVHGQAAFDLQRVPCVLDNVPHALDLSLGYWENEIAVALRANLRATA